MNKFKKTTTILSAILVSVGVILFCLLFTAPGNHFIAYSANKLVDGLKINLPSGCFLYNDAFDISYDKQGLKFSAKQLKIDLYWWGCDGVCVDNLSAQTIDLKLDTPPSLAENPQPTDTEMTDGEPTTAEQITLPINVTVKRIAVNRFTL